jgi:hypothetical protein
MDLFLLRGRPRGHSLVALAPSCKSCDGSRSSGSRAPCECRNRAAAGLSRLSFPAGEIHQGPTRQVRNGLQAVRASAAPRLQDTPTFSRTNGATSLLSSAPSNVRDRRRKSMSRSLHCTIIEAAHRPCRVSDVSAVAASPRIDADCSWPRTANRRTARPHGRECCHGAGAEELEPLIAEVSHGWRELGACPGTRAG